MSNPLQILKELIKIDSNCNISNKEIIEYIKNKLNKFEIREFSFKKGNLDLFNLIVKVKGESSETPLVFAGHTDTVPASEKWTQKPFQPVKIGDKIFGLGASDMKAGLACMISAALSLKEKPKNDVYLLFDSDEEGSLTGGLNLVENFSLKNARVIVPEPTDRKIIIGQKGCLDLEIKLHGKGLHSGKTNSQYNEKYNAINKAIRVCNRLIEYEKKIEEKEDSVLGKPNMNIGRIEGGVAPNMVADTCSIKVSRRLLPNEDIKKVLEEIKEIVRRVEADAEFKILFWGEPFQTEKNGKFIRQLEEISNKTLKNIIFDIKPSWTEAALFARYGEAVIFGPGSGEKSHKPDEYAEIDDLYKFTEIYKNLMEG